jgi:hypothetical protein
MISRTKFLDEKFKSRLWYLSSCPLGLTVPRIISLARDHAAHTAARIDAVP